MSADSTIRDILAKYDEDMREATWKVQGTTVIYHRAIERIAAKAGIKFDPPQILRAERDEAVILVTGRLGEMTVWSIGEALVGVNYCVSGKQAAYVFAIAEKRAVDRVVLKLIGLHGLAYSEEEADQFKDERPRGKQAPADEPAAMSVAQMLHEIEICEGPADIEALKGDPSFRAAFKAASQTDRALVLASFEKFEKRAAA